MDTSPKALDALESHILTTGLEARVNVEYVCQDAWDFLREYDDVPYDNVIATKCVGLILASGPSRKEEALFDLVSDVLAPDGSFFTDHHLAFSAVKHSGLPIRDLAGEHYNLATIAGRYADDLAYSWAGMTSDTLKYVASYSLHETPSMVQCWQMFHFRMDLPPPPVTPVKLLPARLTAPATIPVPAPTGVFDKVADAMIPLNNKGVKRIPTASDLSKHLVSQARLKLDGRPGVLQLQDSIAVFVSPSQTFAFELNRQVTPGLTLAAELVEASSGGSSLFVTGVIAVDDSPADPLDYVALAPLVPFLESLGPCGIMPSTPELVRLVRGDMLEMNGPSNRLVRYPVDGLQVTTNGRSGVFMKPPSLTTIDSTPEDIAKLLDRAGRAIVSHVLFEAEPARSPGVWEYALSPTGRVWVPVRHRPDKTKSDTLGAVIHTLSAHRAGVLHKTGTTVEQMVRILAV